MQRLELRSTDSTLAEARRLVSSPDPGHGINPERAFAVIAQGQTAPPLPVGGVWLTVAWPMHQPLADYATAILAADLALAECLEPAADRAVRLAWPGDLLLGPARVAAVRQAVAPPLHATRRPPTLLLTIAAYADLDPAELPRADYPQTSLRAERAPDPDARRLLDRLLPRLRDRLVEHEHSGPTRHMVGQLRQRLAFVGEPVRIEVSGTPRTGVVRGLRDDGKLLAEIDGHAFAAPSGRVFIPSPAGGAARAFAEPLPARSAAPAAGAERLSVQVAGPGAEAGSGVRPAAGGAAS